MKNENKYIPTPESIERAKLIVSELKKLYPDAVCSLEYYGEPWKLLVMGRLSAQCTDARVNIVCRELFSRFPTAKDLADGELSAIEEIVKPCGLYRTKAKSVKDACAMLVYEYGGVLPDDIDTLLTFPGVGRKIANLLLGDVYRKSAIVADTHFIRLCGRFGFYPESLRDPQKVEYIMREIIPEDEQTDFCHRCVSFGRDFCRAKSPLCSECPIKNICKP